MEENLRLDDYLNELFALTEKDYSQYSPLTLAYIGDDVYDTIIRTIAVKRANRQAHKLHAQVTRLVNASAQARIIAALAEHLTKEEADIYRRGRNAKPTFTAKNASREEYLEATGFEALVGYLYLKRDYARLLTLIAQGLKETGYEI